MRRSRFIIQLIVVVVACWAALYALFRLNYPCGPRTCFLPCMGSALQFYAMDHDDMFPDGPDAYAALQKLYPKAMPDPEVLAGISGDRKATARVLTSGGVLTSNECSWVYLPGLSTTNEGHTILIYERRSGLAFNGRRAGGRAVGFVDGSHWQMPEQEFQQLLKMQQSARPLRQ